MPARDPSLEQQWRDRIERLSRSGLTTIKFAQQEGVPVHQVTWWRRELKKRDSAARNETPVARSKPASKKVKQSPKFVPVAVTSTAVPTSIEIVLERPARIRVASGFDADLLREIISVLESR